MRKIFVNGDTTNVRTLSPFAYKDTIKTLDKSNEARVTLDGTKCFRSAVTSGRDVKSGNGGVKFHLYFYATQAAAEARDTALREFLPITGEEFRAYKNDPAYVIELVTANTAVPDATQTAPAAEPAPAEAPAAEPAPAAEAVTAEAEATPQRRASDKPTAANTSRKAKRAK